MARKVRGTVPQSGVDAARERVRAAGLRCTAARLTVLRHVTEAPGPQTHADVAAGLRSRGFDRATIYRNLIELTDAGILSRIELGDHVWRFELKRPGAHASPNEDHPHFLCTSCGEVSCLDDVNVAITPKPGLSGRRPGKPRRASAAARPAGIRSVTEVLLKGQCDQCG